jgi:hypothetical protein
MDDIRMPALYGLPARDAVARLVAETLVPEIYGTGWVVGQEPSVGTLLSPGSQCTLILGPRGDTDGGERTRIVDKRLEVLDPIGIKAKIDAVGGDSP